jgi:hypothetical protein
LLENRFYHQYLKKDYVRDDFAGVICFSFEKRIPLAARISAEFNLSGLNLKISGNINQ